jgi:hypothetical protein
VEAEEKPPESPTFRAEAMAHHRREKGPGEPIKLSQGWTTWLFYSILALVLAALITASLVKIDRRAVGATALDRQGQAVVLLPAALTSRVAEGAPVELGDEQARVTAFDPTVLYPPGIKRRYGVDVSVPSVLVVTSAGEAGAQAGSASVLIEQRPLLVALIPGLSALFGEDDA